MKLTIDEHIKAVDKPIEIIAHIRRMAELDGADMEKFDERLNELCAKKHEKFAKMGDVEIALYGLKMIFDAGAGEKLAEALRNDEE